MNKIICHENRMSHLFFRQLLSLFQTSKKIKKMAEEKLRIGTWLALITLALLLVGQWVTVNSRISVLEMQVKSDHELYDQNTIEASNDIKGINMKLDNIQQSIIKLSDLKADKEFVK